MEAATKPMNELVVDASHIPALDHAEAGRMAREELDRFLTLVESLSGEDWEQRTDCTEWTVRDILAHQAGAYAGGASFAEFRRQYSARPAPGQLLVDAAGKERVVNAYRQIVSTKPPEPRRGGRGPQA